MSADPFPNERWTIYVCPECGAVKGTEAEWKDGRKVPVSPAYRTCGPTHEHPRVRMRQVEVVPASFAHSFYVRSSNAPY